ncbi:hypothetical protein [Nitrospira sp. M1]
MASFFGGFAASFFFDGEAFPEPRVTFFTCVDGFFKTLDFGEVVFAATFFFETTFFEGGLFLPLVVRETLFFF